MVHTNGITIAIQSATREADLAEEQALDRYHRYAAQVLDLEERIEVLAPGLGADHFAIAKLQEAVDCLNAECRLEAARADAAVRTAATLRSALAEASQWGELMDLAGHEGDGHRAVLEAQARADLEWAKAVSYRKPAA